MEGMHSVLESRLLGSVTRGRALGAAVAVLFVLLNLQMITASAADIPEERVFKIAMGESILTANPYAGINDADYLFYSYIYDQLLFPNETGVQVANLARSWCYMDGNYAAAHGTDFSNPMLKTPAREYQPSDWPMGSIWQYNLTPSVKWSDGTDFTADDVVWTIDIQVGQNFMTYWAYQPYTRWIHHAEKVDDLTVRVFFSDYSSDNSGDPVPAGWADNIALPILPRHLYADKPMSFIALSWTGTPTVGTGPFVGTDNLEEEIMLKESVTLIRNPYYIYDETLDNGTVVKQGLGAYYNRTNEIEKLVMMFYSEEQTLLLDLKAGKIDCSKISPINYFALQNSRPETLQLKSILSSTVFTKISHWNVDVGVAGNLNPARLDPAIHRACALATDRQDIVDTVFKGLGIPGVSLITPVWERYYWDPSTDTSESYFNVTDGNPNGTVLFSYHKPMSKVMGYDLALANQILDKAGYEWSGTPGASLRVIGPVAAARLVNMSFAGNMDSAMYDINGDPRLLSFEDIFEIEIPEDKEIAEYIAVAWEAIGMKMTPRPVDVGTWNTMVYGYQYHFTETYWSGDVDPNYLLYVPTTYAMNGWNEFGVQDPVYDRTYDLQARGIDIDDRLQHIYECQKQMYLWGHMIVTCCPMACFAYNDLRWTEWGNFSEEPGLAFDHFWGETPLLYHIKWAEAEVSYSLSMEVTGAIAGIGCAAAVAGYWGMRRIRKNREEEAAEAEEE